MSVPTEEKKPNVETPVVTATPAAGQSAGAAEPAASGTDEAVAPAAVPAATPAPTTTAPAATEAEASKTENVEKPEVPAKDETDTSPAATGSPVWPDIAEDHPINKLLKALPDLIHDADGHSEVYGISLDPAGLFHTKLILQKFLRANANDVDKAKNQLSETLKWRSQFNPLSTLDDTYTKDRYEGLGYVIEAEGVPGSPNQKDVITFNIYGAVKDNKATFGDVEAADALFYRETDMRAKFSDFAHKFLPARDEFAIEHMWQAIICQEICFLRWRVAVMEMGIKKLNLANATQPIPDHGKGPDPYQGIQVHDYLSVSFIRQDPNVKAATRRTIDLFSKVYPETLSRKFFVNVPVVMGWMFQTFKLILPKETTRKFTVLSYGNQLAGELGPNVPEVYGGKTGALGTIGEQTKF